MAFGEPLRLLLLAVLIGCGDGEDVDGDGYGATVDCDDTDPLVYPGADEICDGWDNDCDGRADVDAVDGASFFLDLDGDGYGDPNTSVVACAATAQMVSGAGDCDDTSALAFPGAPEACDAGADLNCDGSTGFEDADQDGYAACEECNDGLATAFPGATEDCNGADNDCDGFIDEGACNYGFASDIQPIMDGTCTRRCHSVPAPSASLDLERDAYAQLISQPSEQTSLDLIVPGDLDRSYFAHKLRGTHMSVGGSGTRMPKTGSLAPADLAVIEAWILDGCAP